MYVYIYVYIYIYIHMSGLCLGVPTTTAAPLVKSRNSFMKPCFTPIDWMSGLFENRSACTTQRSLYV